MGRGTKFGSGLVLAAAALIGMFHASASTPVHRFLAYYEAVQNADAPLDVWERVAASYVLTQAAEQTRKAEPTAICSRTSSL
jgi:hypothetical protein